jgi:hypothetical protein
MPRTGFRRLYARNARYAAVMASSAMHERPELVAKLQVGAGISGGFAPLPMKSWSSLAKARAMAGAAFENGKGKSAPILEVLLLLSERFRRKYWCGGRRKALSQCATHLRPTRNRRRAMQRTAVTGPVALVRQAWRISRRRSEHSVALGRFEL